MSAQVPWGSRIEVALPVDARARPLAELLARHREVEVRVGEAGVSADGLLEVVGGALGVAPLEHHVAEVVVGLGLAVVDGDGREVERLRGALVTTTKEDVAEVRVGNREEWVELDGFAVERFGLVVRRRVFVERARADVQVVSRAGACCGRLRSEDAHDVGVEEADIEVDDELPCHRLERPPFVRADDDAPAIAHEAKLLERPRDAGKRLPESANRPRDLAHLDLAREHQRRAESDEVLERVGALALALTRRAHDLRAVEGAEAGGRQAEELRHFLDRERLADGLEGLGCRRGSRAFPPEVIDAAAAISETNVDDVVFRSLSHRCRLASGSRKLLRGARAKASCGEIT